MVWGNLFARNKQEKVVDEAGLIAFLDREAAFLSQQTSIEYSRARSGLFSRTLFKEKTFIEALDVCRWEAFAAVLSDMVVILEGRLRPHVGDHAQALGIALLHAFRGVLEKHPVPAHRAEGWRDIIDEATARMARAQLGAPKPPHEVAVRSGKRLFETLPFHPTVRANDKEMVVNSVRFGMIRFCEHANDALDLPRLGAAIAGARTAPGHAN